jgi:hypothetical protein
MTHWRVAAVVACVVSAVAVLAAAADVKVTPVVTQEGRVLASFTASEHWTASLREQLQTGNLVTFDYVAELRRPATLWPDAVLARTNIAAAAKLDTLIGGYTVSRQRDRQMVRAERVKQESEARDWLTIIDQIQFDPESPLKINAEYYVYVELVITPRRDVSLFAFLPGGGHDGSGRADFTFIR